ncbi:hypothetical protein GMST_15490 [Geomonas silvestris]|uniref:Lipoprotein n=1 Tax=Geomonas silvestris TaxID=2740184 RepID=A0A6V8MH39_9BACT|nr:hypothetical protein [Geomonas silvestris]GFO59224.1 hypothetical protein GMST_15490 [Geomonas silvestris]
MKVLIGILTLVAMAATCFADQYVNGYTRKDGTYVNGYTRSDSDSSYNNNYSTKGNTNPYTGESGTNSRTYNDRTPDYNTKTYGNPGYDNSYGSSGSKSGRKSNSLYGN